MVMSSSTSVVDFNPRSPGGERHIQANKSNLDTAFQSTLPRWGATHDVDAGARIGGISIHAPRVGSDKG